MSEKYFGYIYKYTLIPTSMIYVGKRESSEFDDSYGGSGVAGRNAILEYKYTPKHELITREVLAGAATKEELLQLEQYGVSKLNCRTNGIGYNIAAGGQGGSSGCVGYNDGVKEFYIYKDNLSNIDKSWVEGRLFNHSVNAGHVWVNNGIDQTHCSNEEVLEYLNTGWDLGMLYRGDEGAMNATDHFRTAECSEKRNASIRKFHKEHPEFRNSGMFKKGGEPKNKGRFSITNGITNKYLEIGSEIPDGWGKGNTQHHKKRRLS